MNILIEKRFEITDKQIKAIKEMGHKIVQKGNEDVEFLITSPTDCNKEHDNYPNLKYVQLASAGYDRLDLEPLNKRGLSVMNARGVHSPAIAEYILTYILSIYKNTFHYKDLQDKNEWNKDVKYETMNKKRVMFLGAGSIAQEAAKRLAPFGAYTIGLNSDGRKIEGFDECMKLNDGLEDINTADVVVSTLPSSKATFHLLNYEVLKSMKNSSILINIGRGDVIDENGLLKAMDETIRYVVLDVFEEEPLPKDSQLWNHSKVIMTPHLSYSSPDQDSRQADLLITQLKRISEGKKPLNIISNN